VTRAQAFIALLKTQAPAVHSAFAETGAVGSRSHAESAEDAENGLVLGKCVSRGDAENGSRSRHVILSEAKDPSKVQILR